MNVHSLIRPGKMGFGCVRNKFFGSGRASGGGARVFHILCSQFLVTVICSVRTLSLRLFVLRLSVLWTASAQIIQLSRKGVHWISEIPDPTAASPVCWQNFIGVRSVFSKLTMMLMLFD